MNITTNEEILLRGCTAHYIAYLIFYVNSLGERAQVKPNDGPFQPQFGRSDDFFVCCDIHLNFDTPEY